METNLNDAVNSNVDLTTCGADVTGDVSGNLPVATDDSTTQIGMSVAFTKRDSMLLTAGLVVSAINATCMIAYGGYQLVKFIKAKKAEKKAKSEETESK